MKKILLLLLLPLLVMSCQLEEEKPEPLSAPTVPTATELPSTGASRFPTTSYEIESFVDDVISVMEEVDVTPSRYSQSTKDTIDYNQGGIIATGSVSGKIYIHDDIINSYGDVDFSGLKPNKNYFPLTETSGKGEINYSFNSASIDDYRDTFTVSGKGSVEFDADVTLNLNTDQNNPSGQFKCFYNLAIGYGISVLRDDGMGAKLIVSFGGLYDEKFDIESASPSDAKPFFGETATVSIYDDSNTLIGTYHIPVGDILPF